MLTGESSSRLPSTTYYGSTEPNAPVVARSSRSIAGEPSNAPDAGSHYSPRTLNSRAVPVGRASGRLWSKPLAPTPIGVSRWFDPKFIAAVVEVIWVTSLTMGLPRLASGTV